MGQEKQFHITYTRNLSFENLNFKSKLNVEVEETCFKRYKRRPSTQIFISFSTRVSNVQIEESEVGSEPVALVAGDTDCIIHTFMSSCLNSL